MSVTIRRAWAMPNSNTFSIKPIGAMIERYIGRGGVWVDPFSRNSPFASICVTNDIDPSFKADSHVEALTFLSGLAGGSVDGVLFDPPYSPRQISECYKGVGRAVHMEDTQSSFYSKRKDAAASAIKSGGLAMCFGWNSQGFGLKRGFSLEEILLVAHGGAHNDTICTVERKG